MTGSGGGPEKTGSVLIVDDDESTRRSLGLIFKKKGHEVETAGTGQEALDKAKSRFFNVALLDIRLPDIEGVEVLASLKTMHPEMAVIMVTGYASLETAVRALNAGASAYVVKPLDMDHVVATVEEALLRQWLVLENRRLYELAQRELAERRKAEEALRRSEERYRFLYEGGPAISLIMGTDGAIRDACKASLEKLGYAREDIVNRSALDFVVPEHHERAAAMLARCFNDEYTPEIDLDVYAKDGSVRTILFSPGQLVLHEGDEPSGILVTGIDITERRRAEAEAARHTKEVEALHAVAQTASQTLDLRELLETALERVVEVMGADSGTIYLLEVEAGPLLLKAYRGISQEAALQVARIELDEEEMQALVQWKDPYAPLSQLRSETTLNSVRETLDRESVRSFAAVPLSVRGGVRGVLAVGSRGGREFGRQEVNLLMAIGSEIAVGIENARLHERTKELSITDELTGLFNRRHFYEVLDVELSRTQRYGQPFSIGMLDLDGFKEQNDKLGHTGGDAILRAVARTLESSLRKTDILFRYGGDEFAIILPGTDAHAAKAIVERLRSTWSSVGWARYGAQERPLSFSAGIAQFPDDAETADTLVFLADTALFRSKREGGQKSTLVSELGEASARFLDVATQDQVYALAATVDARDPLTYGHSKRVATIAEMMGKAIGIGREELARLHAAGLLHDIGKVGIPDSILTKPDKPLQREWRIIRQHSAEGARIVAYVKELSSLVAIVRHHHEWYDGTGYPDGLKGDGIPIGARIISVADAYDTMTTPRPYRDVISHEEACAELLRCSGTQFDPELVDMFVRVVNGPAGQGQTHKPET